jgi:WD40 repeat protein
LLNLPIGKATWYGGVAFSPDGTRVAVAYNGAHFIKIWDAVSGKEFFNDSLGHTNTITNIAFNRDGTLAATGSLDQTAKVWNSETRKVLYNLTGHTGDIMRVALSPDGTRLATASMDGTARVWDLTPPREALFIPFPLLTSDTWSTGVNYSPDGTRLLTGYPESNTRVWDAHSGKELLRLNDALISMYSSDGKQVATANNDKTITVWDAQTGKKQNTLGRNKGMIQQIAFSPEGTYLASANDDGTTIIWDLASGKALLTLQEYPSVAWLETPGAQNVPSVAYSPDGTRLVSSANHAGYAVVWNTTTGKQLFTLPTGNGVNYVAYSPDGNRIALASYNTVSVWDALTGKKSLILQGHTGYISHVAFSPDGKLLATDGSDGNIRVWDTSSGFNLLTLNVDSGGGVSFSADGKRLAVGGWSGISVFYVHIQDVIALAKSRVTRALTTEECQQYLHVDVCPKGP